MNVFIDYSQCVFNFTNFSKIFLDNHSKFPCHKCDLLGKMKQGGAFISDIFIIILAGSSEGVDYISPHSVAGET